MKVLRKAKDKNSTIAIEKLQFLINTQKSENFSLRSIIEKLPGSIYWKDRKGFYLGCNDFVFKMAGASNYKDIIGKTDFEMPWKDYAEEIRLIDEKVMQTNIPLEIEEHPTLANGQQITMLTHKAPLRDEYGDVIGIIGVSIDITERKKMESALKEAKEKAEAANKTKTEFLENMRHDIRTPVAGIIGLANILKEKIDSPKLKQEFDNIISSSYALFDFLNEILEAIKISSGEIPSLKKKFCLKTKLKEVININQAMACQKGLQLTLDYDESISYYLIGDPFRVHRVALELITNAIKFTDKGYVKLIAKLEKKSERDLVIKLVVEDTGIGISPDTQKDIFVQFKRLTPSYSGIHKGSGLGLSIVRQFIEDLQGEIYVKSELQQGAQFICLIPCREALTDELFECEEEKYITKNNILNNNIKQTAINKMKPEFLPKDQGRILLVEDHDIAAIIANTILSDLGCQIHTATTGHQAIELVKNNQYDLIFMDVGLPDMDGYEVTKRIRLYELNAAVHVPIIALTAHVDDENKKRCLDAGMNTILTKPLLTEVADDILNTFIPHKRKFNIKVDNNQSVDFSIKNIKIIDFNVTLAVANNNEKMVCRILNMFSETLSREMISLEKAYHGQDWNMLLSLLHKLNGGARYCGAERLKESCNQLDSCIRSDCNGYINKYYGEVLNEIAVVKDHIHTFLTSI